MTIKLYKSTEIDKITWDNLTHSFNKVYNKTKNTDELISYYKNTILGYTYHAIAYDNYGILAGTTTILPQYYMVNGEKVVFGLSGGTFVKKEYRSEIFLYKDMMAELKSFVYKEGLKIIYGVSNDNSFNYVMRFMGVRHLMDLDYYILPLRIGKIIKSNNQNLINFISFSFFRIFIKLSISLSNICNSKAKKHDVELHFDENFIDVRFKTGYKVKNSGKYFFSYKIVDEDNVKTAYLLEYRENKVRTNKSLSFVINHIYKNENIDAILYIGKIRHNQFSFIKLPKNKHPKRFPVTYEILGNQSSSFINTIKNSYNWDFSLVNFDVR